MKYQIVFILILVSYEVRCQNKSSGKTPEAIKKTFKTKYPNENDPDWHIDKNGSYEANFKIKGIHCRADFRTS